MGAVRQLSSSEILSVLTSRLARTNSLNSAAKAHCSSDEIELEKMLFTQYFFDFSTAIESTLRGIVFEAMRGESFSRYWTYLARQDEQSKPFFLKIEDIKAITGLEFLTYDRAELLNDFNARFKCLADPIKSRSGFPPIPDDEEEFKSQYSAIKKDRNSVAHSLTIENVSFNADRLFDFCSIFFLLFRFYEKLEAMHQPT
ncbi:MAG: hypothetical protein VZR78_01590 [Candidatus Enteromonas sp.]|nr:hypothetical protein [Candidatus Enteromonas sp.]